MIIASGSISLQDLLSFDLQQVQSHLRSLHSIERAQESPERFYDETRGIQIIVHIIDEFLSQQFIRLNTANRSHLLDLRAILYSAYQSRLNLLSRVSE
jgi:hypothetical protein